LAIWSPYAPKMRRSGVKTSPLPTPFAARHDGHLWPLVRVLHLGRGPALEVVERGLVAVADDLEPVVIDRGPAAGLGLDAEAAPQVVGVRVRILAWGQHHPLIGAALWRREPCAAQRLVDRLVLLVRTDLDLLVVVEQAHVAVAQEDLAFPLHDGVELVADDGGATALPGHEVGPVEVGYRGQRPRLGRGIGRSARLVLHLQLWLLRLGRWVILEAVVRGLGHHATFPRSPKDILHLL
jgi:hypothetical protein